MSFTIVLAADRRAAELHCRERGIPPFSRNTIIPLSPQSTEGLRLTYGDKILCCPRFFDHPCSSLILRVLETAAAKSRIELADIWEDIEC